MAVTDLEAAIGDSGGAVMHRRSQPAGIAAREFEGKLGFTALAEGLADLGLGACMDPNCGLDPEAYR